MSQPLSPVQAWIYASRPHTLPLAICGIVLGKTIAYYTGYFDFVIALLSVVTAILFQIISNFANDYGDYVHGADNEERSGPDRMVQSGVITRNQMKVAIFATSILAILSAIILLMLSYDNIGLTGLITLFIFGLLSVFAAITYTASDIRYGYRGFGDIAVFLFFGLLSTAGSYFLQTGVVNMFVLIPGAVFGLFSTAVLNINNLRDIENDRNAGKITIPVKLGFQGGKIYHAVLLLTGITVFSIYLLCYFSLTLAGVGLLFMIPVVLNLVHVLSAASPSALIPLLKQMVLACIAFLIGALLIFIIA